MFWDGNKRTSLVFVDKILLQSGAGMLTIAEECMEQFNERLLTYYNTGEMEPLKLFMYGAAVRVIGLYSISDQSIVPVLSAIFENPPRSPVLYKMLPKSLLMVLRGH